MLMNSKDGTTEIYRLFHNNTNLEKEAVIYNRANYLTKCTVMIRASNEPVCGCIHCVVHFYFVKYAISLR